MFPSGSAILDSFLEGGYEPDILTTLYGPAGSGKTNIMLLAVYAALRQQKKVLYIDTEASFSVERMQQIMPDFQTHQALLMLLKPTNFEEQKKVFHTLHEQMTKQISLIIIDSIAMLYRLEMGKSQDVYTLNKELGTQLGTLSEIARKYHIPVLITNQVYADFENKDAVKMVGGDILKYSSKCLLEVQKDDVRYLILQKHRSIAEGKKLAFSIVQQGIEQR